MSELTHKKMVLAFSLLSFGVMVVGGVLSGTSVVTALVRATEAAVLFGCLVWLLSYSLIEKESDILSELHEDKAEAKSEKQN